MKLLIIRHGDPDYEHDTLTKAGWKEAKLLGERLCKQRIDEFYLSPLGRAQATAKPTLDALKRTGTTLPWLQEFRGAVIDPCNGQRHCPWNFYPQYWTLQEDLLHHEGWRENGLLRTGDVAEVYDETVQGLDSLLKEHGYMRKDGYYVCENNSEKVLAFFCHFGLGMVMLAHLLMISPAVLWHSFFLPTTSVTTLVTEERRSGEVFFRCASLGDARHLEDYPELGHSGLFSECYGMRREKAAQ